jgi:hypothetical protein
MYTFLYYFNTSSNACLRYDEFRDLAISKSSNNYLR